MRFSRGFVVKSLKPTHAHPIKHRHVRACLKHWLWEILRLFLGLDASNRALASPLPTANFKQALIL